MLSNWKTHLYRISIFAAVILGVGGLVALSAPEAAVPDEAPDFELERMNGETFRLSDHHGEVVVVNFWATWCPPCRKEIPGFIELQDELGDEGLTFVGVSRDDQGFVVVRPFAAEMGINYPLVVDDGTVAPSYGGLRGLPTTFVVDREGRIAFNHAGYLSKDELREQLMPLLEGSGS